MTNDAPIRLGVSSCLLGESVRYDGGHKRDRFVCDRLGEFVEWVPVCPELEAGLGVPRPAMRLVREGDDTRLREIKSGRDHTRRLEQFSHKRLRALRSLDLCGYVLKKGSPSCGMERVKIYGGGMPSADGVGLFARALCEALPDLPVEEEGRLNDPRLRENFIERIFAYRRLKDLLSTRFSKRRLIEFHTAHKLQLLAHAPELYRKLGRQVAEIDAVSRAELRRRYAADFMSALARMATPGRNANVLQHAAGHLKQLVAADARRELADLIHDYRRGLVPLVVPITLLRHHARAHAVEYLERQTYLEPHPRELMLRNHV